MSAKNRKTKSVPYDNYQTPMEVIENFLDHYEVSKLGAIVEPSAGEGRFIKALRNRGYDNYIIAHEIREEERANLAKADANDIHIGSFLEQTDVDESVRTVIGNPPFSLAMEFILKCKELYPNAEIIFLLRLAFLESKTRKQFWQENPVSKLYVLSSRPKFINNKTDATAYGFFVMNSKDLQQEIHVI